VPTITPTTSAGNVRRPDMIKIPAAIPDAGQNTATSEGAESKASPNRAARKYAMATAPAAPSADIHSLAAESEASRFPSVSWAVLGAFNASSKSPVLRVQPTMRVYWG
jgi:hypothetical protein